MALCMTVSVSGQAPQASGQVSSSPTTIERDQSALLALEQTLAAAGGSSALQAVQGVLGTGSITLNVGDGLQGTVTIRSLNGQRFRSDITLSDGVRTAIADGGSEVVRDGQGKVRSHARPAAAANESFMFPYTQMLAAIANPSMSIIDLGTVTHAGQQMRDIRTQMTFLDGSDPLGYRGILTTRDFLVDPNTFLILSIMDTPNAQTVAQGTLLLDHELQFSGYQALNGVLVPFSSTEIMNGQQLSTITFSSITLGATFTDADFSFQ